jgi:hypothetical protein
MMNRTSSVWQPIAIGIAAIPIMRAIDYTLVEMFDRLHVPTAAHAAA